MNKEDIDDINKICPSEQGIFLQPYGVDHIPDEHVVYMRYVTGGFAGGNCWGDRPLYYTNDEIPKFKALDLVLMKIKPDLTYLQYREIEDMIVSSDKTEWSYYGNSCNYVIKHVLLSKIENYINSL